MTRGSDLHRCHVSHLPGGAERVPGEDRKALVRLAALRAKADVEAREVAAEEAVEEVSLRSAVKVTRGSRQLSTQAVPIASSHRFHAAAVASTPIIFEAELIAPSKASARPSSMRRS